MGQTSISSWMTVKPLRGQAIATSEHKDAGTSNSHDDGNDGFTQRPYICGATTNHVTHQQTPYQKERSQVRDDAECVSSLVPQAIIEPCSAQHLKAFRRLTALLLPIPYPNNFYTETVNDPIIASLTRVVMWGQPSKWADAAWDRDPGAMSRQLVAAIRCKLLDSVPNSSSEQIPVLYISTLGTLSPFRDHGLASQLLQDVSRRAMQNHGAATIMAHVWAANEEALAWYENRGFRIVGKDETYYRRLAPQTAAYLVRKDLRLSDCLG